MSLRMLPYPSKEQTFRIGTQIQASSIRLINEKGEQMGIVSLEDALKAADEAGLNLVEISPNASPPVCKILDLSKYKYEQQRRQSQQKRNQKTITVKEIKLRPVIDNNDFNIRLRNAKRWIADGHKVKVTLRFRGREISHEEIAHQLFERILAELEGLIRIDQPLQKEGRHMSMMIAPSSKTSPKKDLSAEG